MQVFVIAVLFQQLLVCALFDDLAFVHGNDAVATAYSRQTVGNDDDGAAFTNGFHVLHDCAFRFIVERTGGFIQNQNARIADQSTGNGNALALSTR